MTTIIRDILRCVRAAGLTATLCGCAALRDEGPSAPQVALATNLHAPAAGSVALPNIPLQSCGRRVGRLPVRRDLPDCVSAHCLGVAPGHELCKCSTAEGDFIQLRRSGREVFRTAARAYLGTTDDFDARYADLDGDGVDELVVATRDEESVGIAVSTWTLRLVDARSYRVHDVEARVEDYGYGTIVRARKGPGCEVLVTRWESHNDPLRGEGLYFVGRRYALRTGRFLPVLEEPTLRRRLLKSFERERIRSIDAFRGYLRQPGAWLGHADTERVSP